AQEKTAQLADNVDSFENCIQCTICTNVCPIVEYDLADNDYTPQQVMNLLRLGKKHLATGTRMVWNCLTCFSCQEACPQGIKVADIMLELRNNGNLRADAMKLENFTKAG
ncbi:MAG: 4Fe-4S dicluster domain-containing protein, partial [Desulfobacteraceae bacterium]|nr:4Fe-4S dicluster domain-containing protein [Desulfobacteraceae bacterium]